MKIDSYGFGKIVIDEKEYNKDIIICCGKIIDNWWRKDGHNLVLADLEEYITKDIKKVIVGKGYFSLMKVSSEFKKHLADQNIELYYARTKKAVREFNYEKDIENILFAAHLTC